MNNLHELRMKNNLEINELTEKLNKQFGTHYQPHDIRQWDILKNGRCIKICRLLRCILSRILR